LIVTPAPAFAPAIVPKFVPNVQIKLLGTDEVNAKFGLVPLQTDAVAKFVTAGFGLTVTMIENVAQEFPPTLSVGLTRYSTVPAAELLEFVNIWLMFGPEPELAPVIPPVITPTTQVYKLGVDASKVIFGPTPLQME
jgi:hypothetical protein